MHTQVATPTGSAAAPCHLPWLCLLLCFSVWQLEGCLHPPAVIPLPYRTQKQPSGLLYATVLAQVRQCLGSVLRLDIDAAVACWNLQR
jgi:hypothetical protein